MTIVEILETVEIPPLKECGTVLSKIERLKTYFYKLANAPFCNTNHEALDLINNVLVEVEDCHSGVIAEINPALDAFGRMYPIQDDFILQQGNRLIAKSKSNDIIIENNGDFTILDRKTDLVIMRKIR